MSSWEGYYKVHARTKCLNGKSLITIQLFKLHRPCLSWDSVPAVGVKVLLNVPRYSQTSHNHILEQEVSLKIISS